MFISPQVFSFPDSVEPVKCRGTPIWTLTPVIPGIQARRGCVFAAVVERDFWKPVWGTEDPSGKGIVLRRGSWGKGFIQLQCSNLRVGSGNREKVFLSTACEICALTQHLWTHAWLTKEKAMQKEMSKRRTKGKELFWLCKTLGSRAGSLGSSWDWAVRVRVLPSTQALLRITIIPSRQTPVGIKGIPALQCFTH